MTLIKRKTSIGVSMFLLFFAANLLENLFIHQSSLLLFTSFIGLIVIMVFWHIILGGMMRFDLTVPIANFVRSVGVALLVFAVSFGLAVGAEQALYHFLGNPGFFLRSATKYAYTSLEMATVNNTLNYPTVLVEWAGAVVSVIYALFAEFLFRGLLINVGQKSGNTYISTNVRQAVMYTLFTVAYTYIVVVRQYILHGNPTVILLSIVMLLLYTVSTFLYAFGLGVIRKTTDSIWGCVVLTFLVDFFIKDIHVMPYLPIIPHCFLGLVRVSGMYCIVFLLSIPGIKQCIKRDW